ncbi:MAG TPA: Pycsar system effector family protein [Segetibacter sp.]|jgi:HD superfamily phosphodiesterase
MDSNLIYKKVESHVIELYENNNNPSLLYHNIRHTKAVVSRTKEIAGHYDLSEKDMLIVYVAAWFHDTGYLFTEPALHEEKSAELMRDFMSGYKKADEIVDDVEACILATKPSRKPENLCQEILKDADTYHLGTKEFKEINKLVMAEFKLTYPNFNKEESTKNAVDLLSRHQFYTSYCKRLLDDYKIININKLKKKSLEKSLKENAEHTSKLPEINEKNGFMTKGVQTMLRLTSDNHVELSGMADGKANILISVNAIIISVILTVLLRRLQVEPHLTIPTIIFLAFSVSTIVIAILATRPKVTGGTFSEQDITDKKTNLLFFGNFHKTPLDKYENAMRSMMMDSNYLYGSLIKDIYYLGVVLGRKYKLIRLAYNVFMVGIVVSVIAFAVAVFFNAESGGTITNASGTPL